MGKDDEISQKAKPQLIHDPSSIYFLHPSEGSGMALTKYILTGDNYDVWVKAIVNGLEGKNKYGFINGEFPKPTNEKSAEFIAWRANNSTLCGWLFNSIDITIQPSVAGHKIISEMWLDLKERYSIMNGPRIHQLKTEYHNLRQKGMNVVSYYNKFKALWDELYGSDDLTCGCICVAASKIRARVEVEKTHDFLMGLDDEQYGPIRSQILCMDHFPIINKAFSMVSQEERHKSIVRNRDDKGDAVMFAVQTAPLAAANPRLTPSPTSSDVPLTCTYCNRIGHDYDHCYRRLGISTRGRGRGRQRGRGRGDFSGRGSTEARTYVSAHANATPSSVSPSVGQSSSAASPSFTVDQVQRLLGLIEPSPASNKFSGPHNEEGDWFG